MVTIGDKPILWHILKEFANRGINDFIIYLGYKGDVIKEYFLNFKSYNSSVITNTTSGDVTILDESNEDWRVSLIDTGVSANTGERLKRVNFNERLIIIGICNVMALFPICVFL